ncbi:MAG: hypothetical protein WHV26_15150 [Spirochaetota bacterium]
MNIIKIILYSILVTSTFILPACDRLDMYDIASKKSPTVYAITFNGVTYSLIIYNKNYIKKFAVNPSFPNQPAGISVNEKKEVISFSNTYTAFAQPDLEHWINQLNPPSNLNVIGFHNDYIYLTGTTLMHLNRSTYMWENLMSTTSTTVGIFQGYDGEIYLLDIATDMTFYKISDSSIINITNPITPPSVSGSYLNGYKTENSFYFWYSGSINSIFMVQDDTCTNYNSTSIDSGIIDVAVTDTNQIYALTFITSSGVDYYLYYLENPSLHSQIFYIGHNSAVTYFKIGAIDNNRIIIATNGLISGYNGLFIYNIEKNKVEKIITTEDVYAMYVVR